MSEHLRREDLQSCTFRIQVQTQTAPWASLQDSEPKQLLTVSIKPLRAAICLA